MDFKEYQKRTAETAIYPDKGANLTYPALGLGGEAGEVLEHIKKTQRDDQGVLQEERRLALSKELGDVLWYVSQLASEAGLDLDHIASENIAKLSSRFERGVIHGSGDER